MWSFFSRDPIKDFAYEIGPQVAELNEKSLWSLHHGKRKSNGDPVSIFVYEGKAGNDSQLTLIKAAFKRVKTLRHPNFIIYLDGLETEKSCYIVTEPITPLITYLDEQLKDEKGPVQQLVISWGLHQLAKGLSFLINDCNLVHNNVNLSSVFVDQAGEWKLGGMEYSQTCGGSQDPFTPIIKGLPYLEKYDPPEKITKKPGEKWSSDMWGLGCLTWEVFNGPFVKSTSLKNPGKIPKSLIPNYCELVGANPKSRPNPNKFIESCRAPDGFMNNKFVTTMLFLEEIQIQDNEAKVQFFNGLTQIVDLFPTSFCKQKILPQLLHAFEYGNVGSSVLAPLFKLGKLLSTEEYQKKMVPCVVKLFSSTDRTTRVKLLQQIESFAEHLSPQVVNDQIFPSIVSGFMDSNPVVREQTIKSMLHLACKLNYKNLNEELLKHFARLQSKDDQGGIRTNTTVCLGKVACYLHPQVRQRVLSSAFLRALKDPFPPARQAGILAMSATHNFFTLQESSQRLLPALCQMSMDPDKTVRDQVFRSIKCFLGKLEKVSENPDLLAEVEKEVNAGGLGATNTSGWAGWAVSGMTSLTSKIYSSKKGPQATAPTPISAAAAATAATTTATTAATSSAAGASKAASNSAKKVEMKKSNPGQSGVSKSTYEDDDDGDGEDDRSDYGDDDVIVKDNHNHGTAAADDDDVGEEVGWGDQEWGEIEPATDSQRGSNSTKATPAEQQQRIPSKPQHSINKTSTHGWDLDDNIDDGDWSATENVGGAKFESGQSEEFIPTSGHTPASSYNWDRTTTKNSNFGFFGADSGSADAADNDEFFNSLLVSSESKKPAQQQKTNSSSSRPLKTSINKPSTQSYASNSSSLGGARNLAGQSEMRAERKDESDWSIDSWVNDDKRGTSTKPSTATTNTSSSSSVLAPKTKNSLKLSSQNNKQKNLTNTTDDDDDFFKEW